MTRRSILALRFSVDQIEQHYGVNPDPILQRFGYDRARMDANAVISPAEELAILAELLPQIPDPLAALKLGSQFGLAGYGPYAMLLMSCATVYEAFQLGIHYQSLGYLFSQLSLTLDGESAILVLTPQLMPEHLQRFIVDRDVAGTVHFLRTMQTLLQQSTQPVRIELCYPKPTDAEHYEATWQCPVTFAATQARIVFPAQVLHHPLPNANPTALTLYRQQCDEVLQQRQSTQDADLPTRVLHYLSLFQARLPSIQECAGLFNVSERHLRRRLTDSNTSYQTLLDQTRLQRARHFLQHTHYRMEDIADRLGFTEAGAFSRAFKKWQGITPLQYRKQQTQVTGQPQSSESSTKSSL